MCLRTPPQRTPASEFKGRGPVSVLSSGLFDVVDDAREERDQLNRRLLPSIRTLAGALGTGVRRLDGV
jgi:hypothetical protein